MVVQDARFLESEDCRFSSRAGDWNLRELMRLDDAEADPGILFNLVLQVLGEVLVALPGDDGERIDFEAAQALTVLIDAKTKAASDRLPPFSLGPDVPQCADLEDIGIVPPLAQCGMREDELERLIETQQLLLVLHD